MPASTRSFVVFQDAPVQAKATLLVKATVLVDNVPSNNTSQEKENLHPVTGQNENQRAPLSKKPLRKKDNSPASGSRVLASKPLPVPLVKSRKRNEDEDGKDRESKKRRPSKSMEENAKDGKKKSRKLPKVVEESALEALIDGFACGLNLNIASEQARIDSRCYDLTVKPLADVSCAYDDSGIPPPKREENVSVEAITKPNDTKSSVPTSNANADPPTLAPQRTPTSDTFVKSTSGPATFSTPERRKIWAAFTFSSPSPASKRVLAGGSMLSEIPRFEFDFTAE